MHAVLYNRYTRVSTPTCFDSANPPRKPYGGVKLIDPCSRRRNHRDPSPENTRAKNTAVQRWRSRCACGLWTPSPNSRYLAESYWDSSQILPMRPYLSTKLVSRLLFLILSNISINLYFFLLIWIFRRNAYSFKKSSITLCSQR